MEHRCTCEMGGFFQEEVALRAVRGQWKEFLHFPCCRQWLRSREWHRPKTLPKSSCRWAELRIRRHKFPGLHKTRNKFSPRRWTFQEWDQICMKHWNDETPMTMRCYKESLLFTVRQRLYCLQRLFQLKHLFRPESLKCNRTVPTSL